MHQGLFLVRSCFVERVDVFVSIDFCMALFFESSQVSCFLFWRSGKPVLYEGFPNWLLCWLVITHFSVVIRKTFRQSYYISFSKQVKEAASFFAHNPSRSIFLLLLVLPLTKRLRSFASQCRIKHAVQLIQIYHCRYAKFIVCQSIRLKQQS